jgi:exodeoxyribonuclease V alpha subunit
VVKNKRMEEKEDKVVLTGVIKRVKFHNPLNGYAILSVELIENEDIKDNITVTVNQPKIFEGVTMSFTGGWVKHPKFGHQFQAESCYELPPATKEAVIRYLSSGFFPGIGPVTAKKIVNYFGDDALDVFRNNIERLSEVDGINKKKLNVLKESWKENQEMNNIMLFLQEHMVSTIFSVKIYKQYGINAIPIIKKNPYKLSTDIHGVGFAMSDKLAMNLGFKNDGDERVTAAIHHILSHNQSDGHCYLTERQIKGRVKKLINIDASKQIEEILNREEHEEKIVCINFSKDNGREEKRYYSRDIYYDEKYVAEKVIRLSKKKYASDKKELKNKLNKMLSKSDIKLSDEQFDSVIGVLSNGLSVLTGGPGVGKTTTVKFVFDILISLNKDVMLAAPTGRAAQRMTEVIGKESKTIHRLLKWDAANGNFRKSEKDLLETDFIILDESSMIDIRLAASFFRAISPSTQVLLVGDKDQLPSVGPGNLIADLIQSECVPVFNLQKVFRQAEESEIVSYAHTINKGYTPAIKTPIQSPEIWKDGTDCMFIDSSMNMDRINDDNSTLKYGLNAIDMIVKLYSETIPKYMGKDNEIQILTPMNKGSIGTKEINKRVQAAVNPKSDKKREITIGERTFREGDRIIQTANNYDLNVFNGDIGYISKINTVDSTMIIRFGDSRFSKLVSYERSNIIELELAYAITIHKSQGSEFKTIILPTLNQHYIMLYRNLIYTGLTRAKKMAVMIGERDAFETSIKNIDPNIRQTSLKKFLKEHYEQIEPELEFLD